MQELKRVLEIFPSGFLIGGAEECARPVLPLADQFLAFVTASVRPTDRRLAREVADLGTTLYIDRFLLG
jgi:hypothetical protein